MFHFPTFPPHTLYIQMRVTGNNSCRVSPFGHPRITVRLSTPRGLSQIPTSFIGSWCQGIHRTPLKTWPQRCSRPLCNSQTTHGKPDHHPHTEGTAQPTTRDNNHPPSGKQPSPQDPTTCRHPHHPDTNTFPTTTANPPPPHNREARNQPQRPYSHQHPNNRSTMIDDPPMSITPTTHTVIKRLSSSLERR